MAGPGEIPTAAVVSPEFPAPRYFALRADESGEPLELAGFYRPPDRAALLFPDGRGIAARTEADGLRAQRFTLAPLPAGFVYTRIALVGSVLIAAWEEQEDWRVGAAGFMVINGP
jgi:hypothetical protein